MDEVDFNIPPNSLKRLRACIGCSLIKTEEQFMKNGWENCNINMFDVEGKKNTLEPTFLIFQTYIN